MKTGIVELARRAVTINRDGLCGTPPEFAIRELSRFMAPLAVLAFEGDRDAERRFLDRFAALAEAGWGLRQSVCGSFLNDAFCLRCLVECYAAFVDSGRAGAEYQRRVAPWLFEQALIRSDGRVERLPGFQQWHQRNQNVPVSLVYEIAHLLDRTQPGRFDTRPLWAWADSQMVGWDLAWRNPDDSWLYHFIWTWSAYRHASLCRPELLHSENARKSFEFYKRLSVPGGRDLIFGESKPGDLLGPALSLALGARLFRDGEQLWIARELVEESLSRGLVENVVDRGPELFRLYTLWPDDLAPVEPVRHSSFLESPLAGRGWPFGEGVPYMKAVKAADSRYPFRGERTDSWDPLYQVRDPAAYAVDKPDKIVFCEGNSAGALFALADLRAHGLHDHPDALGVTTLIDRGVPWLVETSYEPRPFNIQRWLHNVPLVRPGLLAVDDLKTWQSDTWRGVEPGDAWFRRGADGVAIAAARLRHDGFDYVSLDGGFFDLERYFVFVPDTLLLVLDRFVTVKAGDCTVGQSWHTPAEAIRAGNGFLLRQAGQTMHLACAQSVPAEWREGAHEPTQSDPFYFRPGNPIRDLLVGTSRTVRPGEVLSMAACWSREPADLSLTQQGASTAVAFGKRMLRVASFGNGAILSPVI
jgi:hypothetical protein